MKNILNKIGNWIIQYSETIYKYRRSQYRNYY